MRNRKGMGELMKMCASWGNRVSQLMLLIGGLVLFSFAQAQTLSLNFVPPGPTPYQPGGQTVIDLEFAKTAGGAVAAPLTLNFTPSQIANKSWAVRSIAGGSGVTFTPAGTPNGTGDISFTVNFPAANPRTVTIQIELRHNLGAIGDYSLTANSGATSATTTLTQGAQAQTQCTLPGNDGAPAAFSVANSIVNTYFGAPMDSVARSVPAGTRCLPVDSANVGGAPNVVSQGDLLLVIQSQGAEIDSTDTSDYGDADTTGPDSPANPGGLTAIRQTGFYEFVIAQGAVNTPGLGGATPCAAGAATPSNPDVIPIAGSGVSRGLVNSYERQENVGGSERRNYQVIRVPQYASMAFSGAGSVAALAWNGTIGGVVAVDVAGAISLGAGASTDIRFDASGRGFRGGAARIATGSGVPDVAFRSAATALPADAHGMKGEGIAGTPSFVFNGVSELSTGLSYLNGSNARGAPGNAGGGGNACTPLTNTEVSGGAGGSNQGQGGNGGFCADPGVGVNDPALGGRAPTGLFSDGTRLFMGGGGGAGAKNTASLLNDASGGVGGGIVFIRANTINGSGTFTADGTPGRPGSVVPNESGGGGGGAGGTLVIMANIGGGSVFTNARLFARAGSGGNSAATAAVSGLNTTGPGGGGGGGRFFSTNLTNQLTGTTKSVARGAEGTTTIGLDPYGAQPGFNGAESLNQDSFTFAPGPRPGYICSTGSVPVTLSDVKASIEGSQLVVNFGTASEAGTLGYRVYQDQLGNKDFALNRGQLTIAAGESTKPQRYEVRGENRGAKEIWIEEVETNGNSAYYGPFPLNVQIGVKDIAVLTNWESINAEQRAFRTLERSSIAGRSSGANSRAELKVSADGWYRVTHEQLLAASANFAGVPSSQLRVQRGNAAVGVEVSGGSTFGPGSALSFFGESVKDSLYTDQAVYTLTAEGGVAQSSAFANIGSLNATTSHIHTVKFAPNRGYSFSSPTNDPWYATRIVRSANNAGLATEVLNLSERQPSASERLTMRVWGGTSFPEVVGDHTLAIKVNGTQVATATFDGFVAKDIEAAIPANVLVNGDNQISVQLLSNGAAADVVYLESINVSYQRKLKVEANGQLSFAPAVTQGAGDRLFRDNFNDEGLSACEATEAGCQAFRVELTGPNARAFRVRQGQAQALSAAKVRTVAGASVLEFAGIANSDERYVVTQSSGTPLVNLSADDTTQLAGTNVSYLIVTHPSFAGELSSLVAARQAQGLNVKIVNVESLYRNYTNGEVSPLAISAYLREAKQTWAGLKHVLFVGGDSYDYKNYLGNSSVSFIPTLYRRTHEVVSYAPVDMAYADLNADGRPDLSLGRLPIRTAQELRNVINKTLAYPQSGTSKKLVWANDRDSNGYPFGGKSDAFVANFPGWNSSRVDLNSYVVGDTGNARNALVSAVNAGQALLGFYGHSSPSNWTRESLLTAAQVNQGGLFTNAAKPTGVIQLGCWGAYFVDPQYTSMAHALLLNEAGAAAVVAASALTEIASDEILAGVLLPKLKAGVSFGEANQQSASAIRGSNPGAVDVWLGSSVLGDPALQPNN